MNCLRISVYIYTTNASGFPTLVHLVVSIISIYGDNIFVTQQCVKTEVFLEQSLAISKRVHVNMRWQALGKLR